MQVTSLSTGQAGYSDRLTILPPAILPGYATSGIPDAFTVPSIPGGLPSAVSLLRPLHHKLTFLQSQSLSEIGSAASSAEATVQDVIVQNVTSGSVTSATTYTG